jgi:hypothetical protein
MPATSNRLTSISESVIRNTTRTANQYSAINLAQGFPDFDPPEELLQALERAARGPFHQYAVTWGAPRFRDALARKITHWSGVPIDPDEHLVVTCGGTEALSRVQPPQLSLPAGYTVKSWTVDEDGVAVEGVLTLSGAGAGTLGLALKDTSGNFESGLFLLAGILFAGSFLTMFLRFSPTLKD